VSGPFEVGNGLLEIQFAGGFKSVSISAGINKIHGLRQFYEPLFDSTRPLWR